MAKQARKREPDPDRILDAALALAGEMPWRRVTMEAIARASGASLARVREQFPDKAAFLRAFMARTDAAVMADHDFADASEPTRERLLDVILRRLDVLSAHKAAVRSIVRDIGCDPASILCSAPAFARSMAWSLEAAGVSASGPLGLLRVKGLAAIYLSALRIWLRDESEDLSPTTAHLDRSLRRAERLIAFVDRGNRRPDPAE
jgi:AcrR family transcriptional regulator